MSLYLEDALADSDLTVRVGNAGIREGQNTWSGLQIAPISFGASAEFGAQGSGILDKLDDMLRFTGKALSLSGNDELRSAGQELNQVSLRIHEMTVKSWSGTADPVINVSFAMVNTDRLKNAFEQYYDLQASMYPTLTTESFEQQGNRGRGLLPPYGFSPDGQRSREGSKGLWTVEIGNWFRAYNMLLTNVQLESSMTLDVSKDTTASKPAMPMYAAVTCTFTTERAATQNIVRGWLRRNRS